MASTGSKWLTGCGIGCVVLIVVLVAAGTGGYLYIKSKTQGFSEASTASHELEKRFGKPDSFVPPHGGVDAGRVRVFLDVRRSFLPSRKELEGVLGTIEGEVGEARQGKGSFPQAFGLIRRIFGMIPKLADFQLARNRALLQSGMGQGEYSYYYVLVYLSYLGNTVEDGPAFRIRDHDGVSIEREDGQGGIRRDRREAIVEGIRTTFLAMLRNQLNVPAGGQAEATPDPWRKALEAELAAMEADGARMPWQDGLPREAAALLAPFRAEAEASYSKLLNPIEIGFWSAEGRQGLGLPAEEPPK